MRTALSAVVVGTALSLLVAGCAGGGGPSPGGTATPTVTPTVSAPGSTPPGPADGTVPAVTPAPPPAEDQVPVPQNATTGRDVQSPVAGSRLVLTAVRTASHPGVDRVVFEYAGSGSPGWTVEYVEQAVGQASGEPITVAGRSILRVSMTGTTFPDPGGTPPQIAQRVPGDGQGIVTEVVQNGTFEGDTVSFVGLSGERRPFTVHTLPSPTRVIVDIVR